MLVFFFAKLFLFPNLDPAILHRLAQLCFMQVVLDTRDSHKQIIASLKRLEHWKVRSCHHDIGECQVFLSQNMEDKSKTLYREKSCYECIGNISKNTMQFCGNRKMCKVCSGRHPTILHGFKIQK